MTKIGDRHSSRFGASVNPRELKLREVKVSYNLRVENLKNLVMNELVLMRNAFKVVNVIDVRGAGGTPHDDCSSITLRADKLGHV